MKKLLVGLLTITSLSSFAGIEDLSYTKTLKGFGISCEEATEDLELKISYNRKLGEDARIRLDGFPGKEKSLLISNCIEGDRSESSEYPSVRKAVITFEVSADRLILKD